MARWKKNLTLSYCFMHEIHLEYRQQSFENFLDAQNLTPLVRHYILNALAMVSGDCPAEEVHVLQARFFQKDNF